MLLSIVPLIIVLLLPFIIDIDDVPFKYGLSITLWCPLLFVVIELSLFGTSSSSELTSLSSPHADVSRVGSDFLL